MKNLVSLKYREGGGGVEDREGWEREKVEGGRKDRRIQRGESTVDLADGHLQIHLGRLPAGSWC